MKAVTITCDGCGKDITETGAMPAFRLHLSAEHVPSTTKVGYLVLVYPPIREDHYFCDLYCLRKWLDTFMITAKRGEDKENDGA